MTECLKLLLEGLLIKLIKPDLMQFVQLKPDVIRILEQLIPAFDRIGELLVDLAVTGVGGFIGRADRFVSRKRINHRKLESAFAENGVLVLTVYIHQLFSQLLDD